MFYLTILIAKNKMISFFVCFLLRYKAFSAGFWSVRIRSSMFKAHPFHQIFVSLILEIGCTCMYFYVVLFLTDDLNSHYTKLISFLKMAIYKIMHQNVLLNNFDCKKKMIRFFVCFLLRYKAFSAGFWSVRIRSSMFKAHLFHQMFVSLILEIGCTCIIFLKIY